MSQIKKYASFIKLEHTLFSLPLLLAGAILAGKTWPSLHITILMLVAGVGARVVALVLNRIIDRHFDRENPRTKDRHLASGKMKLLEAWSLAFVGLLIYLWAAWKISLFCLKLSWIPLVAFTLYPYFKRFTKWAHVGLGLVWSLVPMAGFFAIQPSLKGFGPVILLAFFSVFWLAGFDIIYATLDEEFDRQSGLHSLPSALGSARALKISALFHLLAFVFLVGLYGIWLAGPITVMLMVIIGILLFLEQHFTNYVDFAFFHMNIAIGIMVCLFIYSGVRGV